jgi:hypothetical protein
MPPISKERVMNRRRFGVGWAAALAVTFLLPAQAHAAIDNSTRIDVNSISSIVTNHNSYAYDLIRSTAGLEWPKGSGKTAVYAAGLWVGATVNDGTRPVVKVGEYSQQWGPGAMVGRTGVADKSTDRVYKLRRGDTPLTNPDYNAWPVAQGAPVNPDGTPQVLGDMTLWSVCNDRVPGVPTNRAGTAGTDSANSLGLEVQQTTFAFSRSGPLNNILFIKYRIINKGGNYLHNAYVSLWADPDVGDGNDDLVGCDTVLSVGFCYNGSNLDGVYGVGPPCVGWDFFQGPLDKATGKRLPMTSFNRYTNGTDPTSAQMSYNYMQGLQADGTPLTDNEGVVTTYDLAGNPVKQLGNVDSNPGDRRLMLSSGPFEMAPGDTQEVVTGLILGRGPDYLSSITVMKLYDNKAQQAFDANFDLGNPPPAPKVVVRALNNQIDLTWDGAAVGDHQHKVFYTYDKNGVVIDSLVKELYFQGYNVYQSPTPQAGPWKKVATYDLGGETDTVLKLYADDQDATTGAVQRVLTQNGTNAGLRFHYNTTQDQVNGGGIINNKPYYFAVTAYNYDANNAIPYISTETDLMVGLISESLENSAGGQALIVVPASRTINYKFRADHTSGTGATRVDVAIINPDSANGHRYQVRTVLKHFMDGDLPGVTLAWLLKDLNTGAESDTLLDLAGRMSDTDSMANFRALVTGLEWEGPFGGPYINGALDYADNFFGTELARTDLVPVELRFDPGNGQAGYAYRRHPDTADNYAFEGVGTVPFKAYDMTDPAHPRQINVAFVQNLPPEPTAADTTDNSPPRWLPDASDLGGREYLFILKSSYSATPDVKYTEDRINAGDVDMMYAFAARRKSNQIAPSVGDVLKIEVENQGDTTKVITFAQYIPAVGDVYEFLYPLPGQMVGSEVDNDLSRIRAVPNPYLTHSAYETSQFNRMVKFTHLPNVRVTVRIFNLAGDLVRTLVRTDVTQAELTWDLLNENQLPVASGVYIYHVDAPGVGSTVGRMAVFLEREKINFF